MKKFFLIWLLPIAYCLLPTFLFAQENPEIYELWRAIYNVSDGDKGYGVAVDSSGNVYVTGSVWPSSQCDTFVGKYSPQGVLIPGATTTYNSGGDDRGWAITIDSSGYVYVIGEASGNIWIRKYDANLSSPIWTVTETYGDNDQGCGITISSGYVYATGMAGTDYSQDLWIGKYDLNGIKISTYTYDLAGSVDRGWDIVVDSAGYIYICGDAYLSGTVKTEIIVRKYDSSGYLVWASTFSESTVGLSGKRERSFALVLDSSGSALYIAGTLRMSTFLNPPGFDLLDETKAGDPWLWFAKYATTGGYQEWIFTYTATDLVSAGLGIARDSENRIYVTGIKENNLFIGVYQDGGTGAIVISTQTYTLSYPDDGAWDIKVDTSFYIHLTGKLSSPPDILTGKYGFKPYLPTNLAQYNFNWNPISTGSWINYQTVRVSFTLSDYNPPDNLRFNVQFSTYSTFSLYIDSTSDITTLNPVTTNYITSLPEGIWYWRVRAYDNNFGTSSWKTANDGNIAFKIDVSSPVIESFELVAISTGEILSVGTATDTLRGLHGLPYRIYRSTNGVIWNYGNSDYDSGWVVSSYTFTGLFPNTTYWFKIAARDYFGHTSTSPAETEVTLCSPPDGLYWGTVSTNSIQVGWDASSAGNPGDTIYKVEVSSDNFATIASSYTTVRSASSVTVSGLTANTTYYGRVIAYNWEIIPSTTTLSGSKVTLCYSPSNAGWYKINITSVTVNWSPADPNLPETIYKLEISTYGDFSYLSGSSNTVRSVSSATVSGLTPNTTYYGRVIAQNWETVGSTSPITTSTATLAAVPLAQAFDNISTGTIRANWSANGNPDGTRYTLQRSTWDGFNPFTEEVTVTTTYYIFGSLQANTTYWFRVKAVNQQNLSTDWVALGSKVTLAYPASSPDWYQVNITSITVNWSPADPNLPVVVYKVEISTYGDFSYLSASSMTVRGISSATVFGLTANTTYYGRIIAYNWENAGSTSALTSAKPTLGNIPQIISFGTVFITSMTVSWNNSESPANPNNTTYITQVSSTGFLSGTIYSSTTIRSANNTIVTGLSPNTTYYARVIAENWEMVCATSTVTSAKPTLCNTPSEVAWGTVWITSITVSWSANNNPDGTIYVCQVSSVSPFSLFTSSTTTSLLATLYSLLPNTTYYARVIAQNWENAGSTSTVTSAKPTLCSPPDSPYWGTTVTTTTLQISWNSSESPPNPDNIVYRAEVSLDSNFSSIAGSSQTTKSAGNTTIVSLSTNTVYYGRVIAQNWENIGSTSTITLSTATLSALPVAQAFDNLSTSTIRANWSANGNPNGTSYVCEVSTSSDFGLINQTTTTISLLSTFYSLLANTTYYARVKAVNQQNIPTAWINLGSTMTWCLQPSVSGDKSTGTWYPGGTTFTFTNNTVFGAGGIEYYRVFWDTNSTHNWTNTETKWSAGTFSTSPVTTSNNYYLHLNAFNALDISNGTLDLGPYRVDVDPPTNVSFSFLTAGITTIISSGTATDTDSGLPAGVYIISRSSENGTWQTDLEVGWVSSYTWTNLILNTTYWFRIKAQDNLGNQSVWSSTTSKVTLCATPDNLTWQTVGITSVTISWSANNNPAGTKYICEISTINDFGLINQTTTTTSLLATLYSLLPNTTYSARVLAENWETVRSTSTITASTATLCYAPTGVNWGTVFITSITVTWSANDNPGGTTYICEVSSVSSVGPFGYESGLFGGLAYTFSDLAPNTTYWARVIARNWQNIDAVSLLANPKVTLCNLPANPVLQTISTTTLQLSWGTNENPSNPSETVYLAEISTASNFGGTVYSSETIKTNQSATFINLSTNTVYYSRLIAQNWEKVCSTASTTLGYKATFAAVPTNLQVTVSSVTYVDLQWSANTNPGYTRYEIQASTSSDFSLINQTTTTISLLATLYPLSPETTYWFRVRAYNEDNVSTGFSNYVSTITLVGRPAVPTWNSTETKALTTISIKWNWDLIPGATAYRIYSATATALGSGYLQELSGNTTTWAEVNLSTNTVYSRKISASNNYGESALSEGTTRYTLSAQPLSLQITAISTNTITVMWSANGNPDGTMFNVQCSTSNDFSLINQTTTTTSSPSTLYSLLSATVYYLKVRSYNGDNLASDFSTPVSTKTRSAPSLPTNLEQLRDDLLTPISSGNWINDNTPNFKFTVYDLDEDTLTYKIQISTYSGFTFSYVDYITTFTVISGSTQIYTFTQGLLEASSWYWRVKAIDTDGESDWATANNGNLAFRIDTTPPGNVSCESPANNSYDLSTSTSLVAQIASDNLSGLASYYFRISATADFSSNVSSSGWQTSRFWSPSGLSPGTTYWWQVKTRDNLDNESDWYATLNVTGSTWSFRVLPFPGKPTISTFTSFVTSVTVNWSSVTGADKYWLYRSTFDGNYVNITTVTAPTVSYPDTNLTEGTTYYYKVSAVNSSGEGALSTSSTVLTRPSAPTGLVITNLTRTTLTLSWNMVTGADKYWFYRSVNDESNYLHIATHPASPYADSGLWPDTNYYYKISGVNLSGEGTLSISTFTKTVVNIVPALPSQLTQNYDAGTLNWANWTNDQTLELKFNLNDPENDNLSYQIQISSYSNFTDFNIVDYTTGSYFTSGSTITYFTSSLPEASSWYWRVRGFDIYFGTSSWTNATPPPNSAFRIDTTSPSVPVLLSPSNSLTTNYLTLTFNWSDSTDTLSGIANYELQISTDINFGVINYSSASTISQSTLYSLLSTLYYWRVRAKDNVGNYSLLSTSYSLLIDTTSPTNVGCLTPVNNAYDVPISTTLIALTASDNLSGLASYYFRISATANFSSNVSSSGWQMSSSWQSSTLSPGTTYYWQVKAIDQTLNESFWCATPDVFNSTYSFFTLPLSSKPSTLNFSNIFITSVTVNWSPVSNAEKYWLYRSTFNGSYVNIATTTVNNYTDTTLSGGTTYYYKISAVNSSGEGELSAYSTVLTRPSAPTGLVITNLTRTTLTLSWNMVTGADKYWLYRSVNDESNYVHIATTTASPYADSGLWPDTNYYYKVSGVNASGEGMISISTYTTTLANQNPQAGLHATQPQKEPGAPEGLAFGSWTKYQTLELRFWVYDVEGDSVSYRIQVSTDSNFNSNTDDYALPLDSYQTFGTTFTYNTSTLPEATSWYWRIRGFDQYFGTSSWTNATPPPNSAFRIDTTSPSVPVLISPPDLLATRYSLLTFDWSDSTDTLSGIANYELQISTDISFSVINHSSAPTISQSTLYSLLSTLYYWRVRAKDNTANYSPLSTSYSLLIDTTPPTVPQIVLEPVYTQGLTNFVTWYAVTDAGSGVKDYALQCSSDNFISVSSEVWKSDIGYEFTGLIDGVTYWYQVRARDNAGNLSNFSETIYSMQDNTSPSAPSLVFPLDGLTTNYNLPTFDWSDVSDFSGVSYWLQVDTSTAFTDLDISTYWLTTSHYLLPSSLPDSLYYWRVQTKDGTENLSVWSSTRSFRIDTIPHQGSISGKVTETDGLTPIQGALIELLRYSVVASSTTTATDGTYQLSNIPTEIYDLRVSKENYYLTKSSTGVTVIENSTTTVNFRLEIGAEKQIIPNQQNIITISSGTKEIKLEISSGTFTSTTTITVTRKDNLVPPDILKQPNFKGTGIGIEITADTQPAKVVTITVGYTDTEVQGLREEDLVIARYDETKDEWTILPSVVDTINNKITATITQFSLFQIVQVTVRPRTGESVTVYHGVFDPANGEKVGIAYNLSEAGQVKINVYDSLGREIKKIVDSYKNADSYIDWWYGKNDSEEIVASGVYLIYIEAPGIKVTKKVVAVK